MSVAKMPIEFDVSNLQIGTRIEAVYVFFRQAKIKRTIKLQDQHRAIIYVGHDDWPVGICFPDPVKYDAGYTAEMSYKDAHFLMICSAVRMIDFNDNHPNRLTAMIEPCVELAKILNWHKMQANDV